MSSIKLSGIGLIIILAISSGTSRAHTIIHVDDGAALGGDGASWATAYRHLQDGLHVANHGDEVRVAGGTYRPDQDEAGNVTTGDREATFQLRNGVAIRGGYRGCPGGDCVSGDPNERDIAMYETMLSGDLAGDDIEVPWPHQLPYEPSRAENSYHVVTATTVDETTVLDGFTLAGGNANGTNLFDTGGGMFNYASSNPTVANCIFSGNSTRGHGGGMYNFESSSPTLINCTFSGNATDWRGGGMYNRAGSSPTLTNCIFSGNSARGDGGGMYNRDDSSPTLANCTFSKNSAGYCGGMCNERYSNPTLTNCILWGNCGRFECGRRPQVLDDPDSETTVAYSCVQDVLARDGDVYPGVGNIDTNPLFVQSDGLDGAPGTADDDLSLLPRSPCIDAGDNTAVTADAADIDSDGDRNEPIPVDLRGLGRFFNDPCAFDVGNPDPSSPDLGIVDMGAFEYQGGASGDPDGDGVADCDDNCPLHPNPDQVDCDDDGLGDYCALELEVSQDCNGNSIPDNCDLDDATSNDCNANSVPDECDVAEQTSRDCNENGTPDECDVLDGTSDDCNGNGVPDQCDLAEGTSPDCNKNEIPDECDVSDGTSEDCNDSGIPDECEPIHPGVIYVDAQATGMNDRTSWANAANDLQDALYWSCPGNEIWVASAGEHRYTPDRGTADRYATFQLKNGVALYGGFLGNDHPRGGESNRSERDPASNVTILSGDLNGDDVRGLGDLSRLDNSRKVVTAEEVDRTTIIDGFTLTAGRQGLYSVGSDLTIRKCMFWMNMERGFCNHGNGSPQVTDSAFVLNGDGMSSRGGGMFSSGNPVLVNCTFHRNQAGLGSGVDICCGAPVFIGCHFTENGGIGANTLVGGGMAILQSASATLIGCVFAGNSAHNWGGAIFLDGRGTSSILTNCVFTSNSAIQGGALAVHRASVTLTNCTLWGNSASADGGGVISLAEGRYAVTNGILWGNSDSRGTVEASQMLLRDDTSLTINNTNVQGWTGTLGGVGNFGEEPLFVDADGPDDIPGTDDDDLRLAVGSPCIDAGDNEAVRGEITTDLLGNPRFIDDPDTPDTGNGVPPIVDMGAYEFVPGGVLPLHLDIIPGQCPNRLNPRSNKLLGMAIIGEDGFDVTMIDAESVVLTRADGIGGAVTPSGRGPKFGVTIQDVATPFDGDLCGCHRQRADGIDDLVLNFSTREVAAELELHRMRRHERVVLTLSGNLLNGTPFSASDCVRIIGRP